MKPQIAILIILLLVQIAYASPPELFPVYDIYELPTLGGDYSFAYSVNEGGEVAGCATNGNGKSIAVLWSGGEIIEICRGTARSVNDYGQVVGMFTTGEGFLYDPLAPEPNGLVVAKELPPLVEGKDTQAWGINNNSWIVGQAIDATQNWTACLWRDGQIFDIGGLGGGDARAYAINDNNLIVGSAKIADNRYHATIFDANSSGNNINLGTLGGVGSNAVAVNNNGQIVGNSRDPNDKLYAFLYQDGAMTGLSFSQPYSNWSHSLAHGINDGGFIVGTVCSPYDCYPFLLDTAIDILDPNGNPEDGFILPDDLMPPDSPFNCLETVYDISNNGQIVGRGRNKDNQSRCFLMVPQSIEKHTLTIQVEPNNVDTVTPTVGQHQYYEGSVIKVEAQPFTQCPDVYYFDRWTGDVADPCSASTTILIDDDKTITAALESGERVCGDLCHPIQQGDLNNDCYINLADFAIFCEGYLDCTHPDCD